MNLTEAQLKALVDAMFQFAEAQPAVAGRPLLLLVLRDANQTLDTAGIPALLAFLKGKGLA